MRAAERGFLLLSSCLGDPERKPLTTAQLRVLADRSWRMQTPVGDRELNTGDLTALGYGREMAERILFLLSQEDVLDHYLRKGSRAGCLPLTRVSDAYPLQLRKRLGLESPGVLWAKGDISILNGPKIALVGSRELQPDNSDFAEMAGREAAIQGYILVSGNARGADRTAQNACLAAGGRVISIVADELAKQPDREGVLYLSEEDFDAAFSAQRALSRNRVIHALGEKTLVAQCSYQTGGTWDGTVKNLRFGWSPVFCFRDESPAMKQLIQMGAGAVDARQLCDLNGLCSEIPDLFTDEI